MSQVIMDSDLCDGHGRCVELAPAVFGFDDDDYGRVLDEDPPESETAAVAIAIEACPKRAIAIRG